MTNVELVELRKRLGLIQADMAALMGLTLRPYVEIEKREGEINRRHAMLAERLALTIAAERGDVSLLPSAVRRDVVALAKLVE